MVFKNIILQLRTAYNNFYRPLRIDDAIRRREMLGILYAFFGICLFFSVKRELFLKGDELKLSETKPRKMENSTTFRYVDGELTQVIKHH